MKNGIIRNFSLMWVKVLELQLQLIGIGYGIRSCNGPTATQVEIERARARAPAIQTADLNGNGVADEFYVIDGKIAVVKMDGKPVSNSLDSKVFKK